MADRPDYVAALLFQLRAVFGPNVEETPVREFRFHPTRKWRADLAWPSHRLLVEVDGGVYVQGRHTSGQGFERDLEKLNEAVCLGWKVIRVTPRQVESGQALGWLERALNG